MCRNEALSVLYRLIRFLSKILLYPLYGFTRLDANQIPKEGPVLLLCNHRHWLDPFFFLGLTKRKIRIMAKAELFEKSKLLSALYRRFGVFSVKRGETDMAALRLSSQILKEGNILLLFPEGTRNRVPGTMLPLKPGAAFLANLCNADIVLCYMDGKVKPFGKITLRMAKPFKIAPEGKKRVSSSDIEIFNEKIQNEMLALGRAELLK